MTDAVAGLLAALAGGTVEVVDLSQPLSEFGRRPGPRRARTMNFTTH